eukprot:PhF_6_TR7814/c0_g1_i1/m.11239
MSDFGEIKASVPRCNCKDGKNPCTRTREELDKLLKEQLKEANGDTTHWAYVQGDFEQIPCAHNNNQLHHHKDCGRVIGEHLQVVQPGFQPRAGALLTNKDVQGIIVNLRVFHPFAASAMFPITNAVMDTGCNFQMVVG